MDGAHSMYIPCPTGGTRRRERLSLILKYTDKHIKALNFLIGIPSVFNIVSDI